MPEDKFNFSPESPGVRRYRNRKPPKIYALVGGLEGWLWTVCTALCFVVELIHRAEIREIGSQAPGAIAVPGVLQHGDEDGFEEAGVLGERCAVVCGEGGFNRLFCGGGDEFEAADEDTNGGGGGGSHAKRKNGISEAAGDDVDETGTFLEPGIFPGFDHGVGFIGE
jgi:hypothetical protein